MILRQLFERLMNHGIVCVITSKYVHSVFHTSGCFNPFINQPTP